MNTGSKYFILSLFTAFLFTPIFLAQENLEDKIKEIDGSVDKIIISADGKEYVFEGDEAEELFGMMKKKSVQSFVWKSSEDDNMKKKVIVMKSGDEKEIIEIEGDDDDIIIKREDDFDSVDDGITKKVKVEIEDDNKKVTVTTKENGEEKTDIYEGKEAEEFLEKMKSENKDMEISIDKDHDGKKVKKIIIETEKEEEKD